MLVHISRVSVSHVGIFWILHQFNVACFYSCLFHFLLYEVNLIFIQKIPTCDNCYGGNLNAWISLNHNILLDQRVHLNRKCNWLITRHALSKFPNHTSKNVMPGPVSCDSQLLMGPSSIMQKSFATPWLPRPVFFSDSFVLYSCSCHMLLAEFRTSANLSGLHVFALMHIFALIFSFRTGGDAFSQKKIMYSSLSIFSDSFVVYSFSCHQCASCRSTSANL